MENLRPENIHEKQIKNFKQSEIKAKIANGFGNSEQTFGIITSKFTVAMWYTHRYHDDTF